jgi:hypothetical protein
MRILRSMTMAQLVQELLREGHSHGDRIQEINMATNQLAESTQTSRKSMKNGVKVAWRRIQRIAAAEDWVTFVGYHLSSVVYSTCVKW